MALIHIAANVTHGLDQDPSALEIGFRMGGGHSFVLTRLCHSDAAANTSFILSI